jgi:hypothetical protein
MLERYRLTSTQVNGTLESTGPGGVPSTDDFELSADLQTLTETQHLPDQGKAIILVFKRE